MGRSTGVHHERHFNIRNPPRNNAHDPSSSGLAECGDNPRIDPKIRSFLAELNKDSSPFWEKPGPQVRAVLTGLQAKTAVDLSGVSISEKTIWSG